MLAAGLAYGTDTVARTILSSYDSNEALMIVVVSVPAVLAEGSFTLWLFFRAGRQPSADRLAQPVSEGS